MCSVHASSAGEIAMCERVRFGDQRETRFYQPLGEHQPVELRPRFHHKREVLLDLGEPGEVGARRQKLGGTPKLIDAVIDLHRADPGGEFGDIGLDVGRRDLCGCGRAAVEPAGPLQEAIFDKINSALRRLNVYGYRHYHSFDGWMRQTLLELVDRVLLDRETLSRGVFRETALHELVALRKTRVVETGASGVPFDAPAGGRKIHAGNGIVESPAGRYLVDVGRAILAAVGGKRHHDVAAVV